MNAASRPPATPASVIPPPLALAPRAGRLVVGVSLDRTSAMALQRAHQLARALRLELRVVHIAPPAQAATADAAVLTVPSPRVRTRLAKNAVRQWSLFELGIDLPSKSIRVYFGDTAEELCKAATHLRAELLLVGGRLDESSEAPGELTEAILARAACPVLIANPLREGRAMVVATDLDSAAVPVIRVAARLARKLRRILTVVHNVDGLGPAGTYPAAGSPEEKVMAESLEALGGVVREIEDVDEATITREPSPAEGILQVARARDVDVVVVGIRPGVGLTSKNVLAEARRSILAVPLA